MTDKQIEKEIKQVVTNLGNIEFTVEDELNFCKEVLKRKEQEYEELRKYHNKCCEENAKKLEEWLEKYNQVSRDFYNGKYCNKENCNLLKAKEQECEELKTANKILKEKLEIAIKNNMDKTLLRLKNGDVQEELQEIREQFGIETLYFHDDNTRVHRCLDVLRLKDTLAEIKEALQFYKNTKIGVDKGNGIFELEVSNDNIGKLVYCYNTNPAKEALQKISEVENGTC